MEQDIVATIRVVPVSWLIGLLGFMVVTGLGIIRQLVKSNEAEHQRLWDKIDDIYNIMLQLAAARGESNRRRRNTGEGD